MSTVEDGASPRVYQPWTNALATGRAALARAGCPDPPRELLPLTTFTADLSRDWSRMTVDQARSLGGMLRGLDGTLQMSIYGFDSRLLNLPMTCSEISDQVDATYSVRGVATPTGQDVWVVLAIQNRSTRGVYAGADGQLVATHVVGRDARGLSWRSTSAALYSPGLTTSRHPLLRPDGKRLQLTSQGRVKSVSLRVSVGFSKGQADCPIRARRTSEEATAAAAGDIACGPRSQGWNGGRGVPGRCHQRATAKLVDKIDPDAVFALGDLQYQAGTTANFEAGYDPTWGRFKDITHPIPGNHDYGVAGAEGYFTYFGDRATPQDPGCQVGCRGYYSFELGAWHVVALNINCTKLPRGDGCGRNSPQNRWLQRDLKAANKTTGCTVVLMHEPRWSSSSRHDANLDPLVDTMYSNGVDVVLSGNSHTYERFAPQSPDGKLDRSRGITQIVVGTGGGHFTGLHSSTRNSLVAKSKVFGVLQLKFQDTRYTWSFVSDPSTPFKDSGSEACR